MTKWVGIGCSAILFLVVVISLASPNGYEPEKHPKWLRKSPKWQKWLKEKGMILEELGLRMYNLEMKEEEIINEVGQDHFDGWAGEITPNFERTIPLLKEAVEVNPSLIKAHYYLVLCHKYRAYEGEGTWDAEKVKELTKVLDTFIKATKEIKAEETTIYKQKIVDEVIEYILPFDPNDRTEARQVMQQWWEKNKDAFRQK